MEIASYIKDYNGKKVMFVNDKPFYMVSGEIHNSSSSSLEYLLPIFDKLQEMNLNSVLLPISWQMIEPQEGHFDFQLTDQIIYEAGKRNLKLGILWFGSWKNAQCSYCPSWIKQDTEKYFRAQLIKGENFIKRKSGILRLPYSTISPFCLACNEKDAYAFGKLMAHIRDNDSERTVITIQVENETGFLGGDMDYSPIALEKYQENVDEGLINHLHNHLSSLDASLRKQVEKNKRGNWQQVFGPMAHEVFIAYYTAKYVNKVAEAGKKEYPLPFSANCWLNTKNAKPGQYPCGGPVAKMMEVWQYAAPNIDIFAPDLYLKDFYGIIKEFTKNNNPAYIPESKPRSFMIGRQLHMIGNLNATCFASFGVEDIGNDNGPDFSKFAGLVGFAVDGSKSYPTDINDYSDVNRLLTGAIDILAPLYGQNKMIAFTKEKDKTINEAKFGDYIVKTTFLPKKQKDNAVLIAQIADNEFLILGYGVMFSFKSNNKDKPHIQHLNILEGEYQNSQWQTKRIINGDEEMAFLFNKVNLYKVTVDCFN